MNTIRTFTNKTIDLYSPTVEDIDIIDIAHALSNLCRFSGHTHTFYSVAQHSLLVSYLVPYNALRRVALLHDAAEAYLGDVVSPLKKMLNSSFQIDGGPAIYEELETAFNAVIAEKFGFLVSDLETVKHYDHMALELEQGYFFKGLSTVSRAENFARAFNHLDPCFTPEIAKETFLSTYKELFNGLHR